MEYVRTLCFYLLQTIFDNGSPPPKFHIHDTLINTFKKIVIRVRTNRLECMRIKKYIFTYISLLFKKRIIKEAFFSNSLFFSFYFKSKKQKNT